MQYQIRALKLGEVLDQALTLTKDQFKLLFGIMAIGVVPMAFASGLYIHLLGFDDPEKMARAGAFDPDKLIPLLIGLVVINLFYAFIVLPLANAAVMHALAAAYLSQPVTIGESYRVGARRFWALMGTGLLMGLAVFGGMLLLIIPGIIFAFWFSLWQQIVVIEHRSGSDALGRSKALMKGNIGQVFLLGLVVSIVTGMANGAVSMMPYVYLRITLQSLVQAAAMVFSSAAYVVFYFSCRCKHENFDLEMLAQSVEDDIQLDL